MLVPAYNINHAYKNISNCGLIKDNPYKLLKKTAKLPVKDYQAKLLSYTPDNAAEFSYVSVGRQNDNNFKKQIISFFSPDGKLLRKAFLSSDKPTIFRDYEIHSQKESNTERILKKVETKIFDEDTYKYKIKSAEEQKIFKDLSDDKTKLQINKNTINNNEILTEVTEYPWIFKNGKHEGHKKSLKLALNTSDGIPKIFAVKVQNMRLPKDDKYLPVRMIFDNSLKLLYMTKFLLKEKGLSALNTVIKFSKDLGNETAGYFSEFENCIAYNKHITNNPVKLSAHEVQHAYQFAQIGRLGKGTSKYCTDAKKLKGEITDPKEREEALRFYVSAEKYPKLENGIKLSGNENYSGNYLEEDANREAEKIYTDYQKRGEELGKQLIFGNI